MAPAVHYSLYFIISDSTLYTYLFYFKRIFNVLGKVALFLRVAGSALLLYPEICVQLEKKNSCFGSAAGTGTEFMRGLQDKPAVKYLPGKQHRNDSPCGPEKRKFSYS